MALRERLVREGGLTGSLPEEGVSNQQNFQDMKARNARARATARRSFPARSQSSFTGGHSAFNS